MSCASVNYNFHTAAYQAYENSLVDLYMYLQSIMIVPVLNSLQIVVHFSAISLEYFESLFSHKFYLFLCTIGTYV